MESFLSNRNPITQNSLWFSRSPYRAASRGSLFKLLTNWDWVEVYDGRHRKICWKLQQISGLYQGAGRYNASLERPTGVKYEMRIFVMMMDYIWKTGVWSRARIHVSIPGASSPWYATASNADWRRPSLHQQSQLHRATLTGKKCCVVVIDTRKTTRHKKGARVWAFYEYRYAIPTTAPIVHWPLRTGQLPTCSAGQKYGNNTEFI